MYFMDAVPEPVKKPLHEHRQVLLCVGVVVQDYERQQYKYPVCQTRKRSLYNVIDWTTLLVTDEEYVWGHK